VNHMNPRHVALLTLLWLAVVLSGANWWRVRHSSGPGLAGPTPRPSPYTVPLEETQVMGQRREPTGAILTEAVAADGSQMKRLERLRRGAQLSSRLVLLALGTRIETDDILEKATRTRFDLTRLQESTRDPGARCLKALSGRSISKEEVVIAQERMAGHEAVKVHTPSSVAWFALDAGCAPLKYVYDFGQHLIEQTAVSLISGEPDPALFFVPTRYVEVRPSEMLGLEPTSRLAQRLDERYNATRAARMP